MAGRMRESYALDAARVPPLSRRPGPADPPGGFGQVCRLAQLRMALQRYPEKPFSTAS
jgi:hypothetical protein